MEILVRWIFFVCMATGFASWGIAVFSNIAMLRNMKAGFWEVMFHSWWIFFKKDRLRLNAAGERHHSRMLKAMFVFFMSVLVAIATVFTFLLSKEQS